MISIEASESTPPSWRIKSTNNLRKPLAARLMAEVTHFIFTHEALNIYGSRVVLSGVSVVEMYWDNTNTCDLINSGAP